jgi:hypothetical protein
MRCANASGGFLSEPANYFHILPRKNAALAVGNPNG